MEVKDKKESKLKKVKEKTLKVKETCSDSNVAWPELNVAN